jgi:hypothetical protein
MVAGERLGSLMRAMLVARLIDPASKLATAKALLSATAASSLPGLGKVDADELYAALDWRLKQQPTIEAGLAKRHIKDGTQVLYRRVVELARRPLLPVRPVRAQPRSHAEQIADCPTRNEVTTAAAPDHTLILYSTLIPIQQKAFDLLGVEPTRTQEASPPRTAISA